MKALKRILVGLGTLIALFLVVAMLLPANLQVSANLMMNASSESIYEEVISFPNWEPWSPWKKLDPDMQTEYSEQTSGVGSWTSWISEIHGNGRQTITEAKPFEMIKTQLEFEGFGDDNFAHWKFEAVGDSTIVHWEFNGGEAPLYMRPLLLLFKGSMQETFAKGLSDLKAVVEAKPEKEPVNIMEINLEESRWVITLRDQVPQSGLKTFYPNAMGRISKMMTERDISVYAAPLSVCHAWGDTVDLEVGIPIEDSVAVEAPFSLLKMNPGPCVTATHVGSYDNLQDTYELLKTYMKENNKEPTGSPWEVYITDPGQQPDTSQWFTQVFFPL